MVQISSLNVRVASLEGMERQSYGPRSLNGLAAYWDHAMHNVQVFFQHQVDECLELAKGATHREDAEFWKESARRWAELAQHNVKRGDGRRKHPGDGTN